MNESESRKYLAPKFFGIGTIQHYYTRRRECSAIFPMARDVLDCQFEIRTLVGTEISDVEKDLFQRKVKNNNEE